jgi:hypothetical protein
LLVGGGIVCAAGHRLFRLVLAAFGFIVGALVAHALVGAGSAVAARVSEALEGVVGAGLLQMAYVVAVVLAGGLVGAALLAALYFVGVALVGAGLGVVLAHVVFASRGQEPTVLMVVLFSAAGGLLATYLERYVLIAGTAFGGAWVLILGALAARGDPAATQVAETGRIWLASPLDPLVAGGWVQVVWIVLGLTGAAVQVGWTAGARGRIGRRKKK